MSRLTERTHILSLPLIVTATELSRETDCLSNWTFDHKESPVLEDSAQQSCSRIYIPNAVEAAVEIQMKSGLWRGKSPKAAGLFIYMHGGSHVQIFRYLWKESLTLIRDTFPIIPSLTSHQNIPQEHYSQGHSLPPKQGGIRDIYDKQQFPGRFVWDTTLVGAKWCRTATDHQHPSMPRRPEGDTLSSPMA